MQHTGNRIVPNFEHVLIWPYFPGERKLLAEVLAANIGIPHADSAPTSPSEPASPPEGPRGIFQSWDHQRDIAAGEAAPANDVQELSVYFSNVYWRSCVRWMSGLNARSFRLDAN